MRQRKPPHRAQRHVRHRSRRSSRSPPATPPPRQTSPPCGTESPPRAEVKRRKPPTCSGRSTIQWPANSWNGRFCAATRRRASMSAATWLSSPKIRVGPPLPCCVDAPRQRCGQTASIPLSCAHSSVKSTPPPRRGRSRSPARCCCRATAPAHKGWCARPGATTASRMSSKPRRSTYSAT